MLGRSIVLLFIKAPVKGQVKSRLAAAIGEDRALELYRFFILDSLQMLKESAFPFQVCFYPEETLDVVSNMLGHQYRLMPQSGNDLGERMERAFIRVFSEGWKRAILIGSDIPDLTPAVVGEAFAVLEKHDAVIGPAADGGYYLIGFNSGAFAPRFFRGIEWGTTTVFEKTMEKLRASSVSVQRTPQWRDLDTLDDLKALFARSRHTEFDKSNTMHFLRENLKRVMHE